MTIIIIMLSTMSILCLWDIQLTFNWVRIETHGAYPHKFELKHCKEIHNISSETLGEVIAIFRSSKVNTNGQ